MTKRDFPERTQQGTLHREAPLLKLNGRSDGKLSINTPVRQFLTNLNARNALRDGARTEVNHLEMATHPVFF